VQKKESLGDEAVKAQKSSGEREQECLDEFRITALKLGRLHGHARGWEHAPDRVPGRLIG
jgi:hypothetical protein